MAKKKTEKKTKTFSEAIGLQYIFNNTVTDFFLGLALVTISVLVIIAMASYLSTGYLDQNSRIIAAPLEPSYHIGSSTPTLACHHSSYLYSLFYVDCN